MQFFNSINMPLQLGSTQLYPIDLTNMRDEEIQREEAEFTKFKVKIKKDEQYIGQMQKFRVCINMEEFPYKEFKEPITNDFNDQTN